jgi:hypothetical protein
MKYLVFPHRVHFKRFKKRLMKFYIIGHFDMADIGGTTEKFRAITKELQGYGHEVRNVCNAAVPLLEDRSGEAKTRLAFVCNADVVFVLPCWAADKIAQHELMLACSLGKKITWADSTHIPERIVFDTNISLQKNERDAS